MFFVFDGKSTLFIVLFFCLFCLRKVVLAWSKGKDLDFWFSNANKCWGIRLNDMCFLLYICCFLNFLCIFSLFCNEFIHLVNDRNLMLLQGRLFQLHTFLAHFPRLLFLFKRRTTLFSLQLILHLLLMLIHLSLGHIFQSSLQCLANDRPFPKITISYLFN